MTGPNSPAPSPASAPGAPFSTLTPDLMLDAVESVGLRCDGRLLALNSYENRVYQVGQDEGPPVIVKFYRPGRWSDAQIGEEHAFVDELAEREIPVVAPLRFEDRALHAFGGHRFAIYPRRGGRSPELDDRATLESLGRFLGRIHASGATRAFAVRPAIDIREFGYEPRDWLLAHAFLPADVRATWEGVVNHALEGVARAFERANAHGTVRPLRLHGDCHAGNILWTDAGPHFVDFDDARTGPAMQDLWMLLSGDRASMTRQLLDVLTGYEDFNEFDPRELHLLEALRTLRLIHYSAWLARRWDDPAFPAAFPWFNTQRYWEDRILEIREQIAVMDEEPLRI